MQIENNYDDKIDAKELTDKLVSLSSKYQIKKWDLGASCSSDTSAQVDRGEPKHLKGSQRSSITIRVWNDKGLVGITSTSDLSESGLSKALASSLMASNYGNSNDVPTFSTLASAPLPEIKKPIRETKGIQTLLEKMKEVESELIEKHLAIKTVPYNGIAESLSERIYINSQGAIRHIRKSQASLYLYARAEEDGRKPRSGGALRLAHGFDELDYDGCINEAAIKTISHLNYRPIDTGKYLICFSPEAFLDLIGSFSSMFNARAVLDGISLSQRTSIGKRIAVPFFSLNDNGLHPSNISATPFDGEGTPTQDISLVKGGLLENFLHSEATARAFGVQPTGHAGLGAKVSVGADWLVVDKTMGEESPGADLNHKKTNQTFVLIDSLNALHAGVKPSQGSFSLPFDGWLVSQGEKVSIEAATVAGDIQTVLKNIIQIEEEQLATNNGVSPYIWVEELSITGEA